MHPQSRPQARPSERGSGPRHTGYDEDDDEDEVDSDDPDGNYADGEGDPCPNCGRVYRYQVVSAPVRAQVKVSTHGVNAWHAGQVNFGYNVTSVTPGMMASVFR